MPDAARRRSIWPVLWVLFALVLVVRTSVRDRGVITDHLEFGRRLLHGEDPYAPYLEPKPLHPPYPPSFGLLTAPFSLLPERGARIAWGLLQAAALLAVLAFLRRALQTRAPPGRVDPAVTLALALGSRFVLRDTHGGGGNLINLGLACLAFGAAASGRERTGGILLGCSLATKPTMVLLWPLLLAFGHARAALAALATVAAAVLASLALLGFDPSAWLRWLEGSWRYATQADVFAEPALGFPPFTWMNQSLRCAVARFVGEVPEPLAALVPGFVPGLGLPVAVVVAVRSVLTALLLGATAWGVVLRRRDADARLPLLAAVLALSLLLSPISWKAHHVALLPAFALLFSRALAGARAAWSGAALYAAACVVGEEFTGKAVKELLQSSYVITAGTLAFWVFAWSGRRKAPGVLLASARGRGT